MVRAVAASPEQAQAIDIIIAGSWLGEFSQGRRLSLRPPSPAASWSAHQEVVVAIGRIDAVPS